MKSFEILLFSRGLVGVGGRLVIEDEVFRGSRKSASFFFSGFGILDE